MDKITEIAEMLYAHFPKRVYNISFNSYGEGTLEPAIAFPLPIYTYDYDKESLYELDLDSGSAVLDMSNVCCTLQRLCQRAREEVDHWSNDTLYAKMCELLNLDPRTVTEDEYLLSVDHSCKSLSAIVAVARKRMEKA